VLEHIEARDEDRFIANNRPVADAERSADRRLTFDPVAGVRIAPPSKEGHVNCKDERGVRGLMERHFENVFVFSMND